MNRFSGTGGLLLSVLAACSVVQAQEATERFIPIGESPGLSGTRTMIGTIEAVDREKRTLTIAAQEGTYSVAVTPRTRIWIDRSREQQPALTGTFRDCDRGRRVEVKLEEGEEPVADWIKVQADARASDAPSR